MLQGSVGSIANTCKLADNGLDRDVAVIAPEQIVGAFSVLIDSAPHLHFLASAAKLDELRMNLGENLPNVVLVYLVQENVLESEWVDYEVIKQLKKTWTDAFCISIVKYASQAEKAKEAGADIALVDGANAERILAAIEGKSP